MPKTPYVTGTLYLGEVEPDCENWIHVYTGVPDNSKMLGMVDRSVLMKYISDLIGVEAE